MRDTRGRRKKKGMTLPFAISDGGRNVLGARDKVGPCYESYAWVPETEGFVAFQKVGVSPTLVISYLVAI